MSRRTGAIERPLRRPVVAGALLLAAYAVLSLFMDTGGYLGTDTGAKVATLEVMDQRDTWHPEVGYWAEEWDPTGALHPLEGAQRVEGGWIDVTTLPMLELGHPLYSVGGYRLALLLPMLGGLGAAFASRAIARRMADDRTGWLAFWIVGLGSPIAVYALDFWEHAPGVACMVGAVVLLAGVLEGAGWGRAVGAGALLGLAAAMRGEALVFAAVSVGLALVLMLMNERDLRRPIIVGIVTTIAFAVVWFANAAMESALGGNARAGRAGRTAGKAFDQAGDRLHEGLITTFATGPGDSRIAVGVAMFAVVVLALVLLRRGEKRAAAIALGAVAIVQLTMLLEGVGFVPGLFAAAPLAALALVVDRPGLVERYVLLVAVGALPLVWATQLLGGAGPQWAGRYTLTSAVLLLAVGAVRLRDVPTWFRGGIVTITVFVTATGLLWLSVRSHDIERFFDDLVARPEEVVVAENLFFIREGGPAYTERLWLNVARGGDVEPVIEVLQSAGKQTFVLLSGRADPPPMPASATFVGTDDVEVVNIRLYLHSYELQG